MRNEQLPDGYHCRPPAPADAPAVAAVIAAYELDVHGEAEMTEAWLLDDWNDTDLENEAVVVVAPGGEIAAYADVLNRSNVNVSVYGYVHPEHRGRGLGSFLVAWGEDWTRQHVADAPPDARIIVQHYLAAADEGARRILARHGYQPVRGYYVMHADLESEPQEPEWPAGIHVRTFRPGADEAAAFEALEDAFQDAWGRPPGSYERFLRMTKAERFDSGLWFLAMDGEDIAGILMSKLVDGEGWIDAVGVRRPWRRRGLALAMLRHVFRELRKRGATEVGLSVDAESLTGAPRVYERAGMSVKRSYVLYQKELRSGVDYGAAN